MGASHAHTADSAPLTWRQLGPADIDAVEALHHRAMGPVVRPDIVKPEKRSYFEGILGGRGRIIGAFGPDLLAYGILQHQHAPTDTWEDALGVPRTTLTGRLSGASVAPELRGRRLQRATIAARISIAPRGMLLFSTAAPANVPSWTNLLAEGFPMHALVPCYGGYLRYLMVRDRALYRHDQAVTVDPQDLDTQRDLFARGWRGFARTQLPAGGPGILFAPATSTRA